MLQKLFLVSFFPWSLEADKSFCKEDVSFFFFLGTVFSVRNKIY